MLAYWVVFAVLVFFQRFLEPFVSWFPFYSYGKLGLALFVAFPETGGAAYLFQKLLSPFVDVQERAFLANVWPKLQKRLLRAARRCELAVIENSAQEVSLEELGTCERDAEQLLVLIRRERERRKAS